MMDELVQDLVSALEQPSEQRKLWEEMVLSPLQRRRQIRRRRGRKRCRDSSLYSLEHRRYWIEASESSLDEARVFRGNSSSTVAASLANCSDSDDVTSTCRWRSVMRGPVRTRQPSWPESDSFTENNPGRQLRRRRKVKRMTPDITLTLQQKLKVSGVDRRRRHRPSRIQHLSGSKKRSGGWVAADHQTEGARQMGNEWWKRKMAKKHRDAAEDNMSEGETSSTCSSDPGLFTNDEGRQGDDEQSDWFFEGDCGVGAGVAGLLPSWDSDNQLSLEDNPSPTFLQPARPSQRGNRYHSHLKRVPGAASCCIRKDRRRLPSKANSMPVFVKRLRHFSQDSYQRDFWLPSVGKRERSQSKPLCPIDMMSESSRLRCPSSVCRNRQTNVSLGLLSTGESRRRERGAATTTTSASNPFHKDHQGEEAQGASNTSTQEAVGPNTKFSQSFTSAHPESLSFLTAGTINEAGQTHLSLDERAESKATEPEEEKSDPPLPTES
ncbi:G patch domain-containing protein 2-like [Labrus bergylta]|uniref:G patch domain-containing protein 2-like n=1 Tax=Labrus bergylta TaxID=56723 RepID=UPI0033141043